MWKFVVCSVHRLSIWVHEITRLINNFVEAGKVNKNQQNNGATNDNNNINYNNNIICIPDKISCLFCLILHCPANTKWTIYLFFRNSHMKNVIGAVSCQWDFARVSNIRAIRSAVNFWSEWTQLLQYTIGDFAFHFFGPITKFLFHSVLLSKWHAIYERSPLWDSRKGISHIISVEHFRKKKSSTFVFKYLLSHSNRSVDTMRLKFTAHDSAKRHSFVCPQFFISFSLRAPNSAWSTKRTDFGQFPRYAT